MESTNFQENFHDEEQTSAYCENYITYPLSHLRIDKRRQKRQREPECERQYERFKKQKSFKCERKHMQRLNFDEQEFLHHSQKRNSSKSHLHYHHRGSNAFIARPFQSDFVSQKIVTNPSMTPTMEATNFWRDEESRSARNEDDHSISRIRTKEEKQKRREEWLRQQERERQHEKLKQQKILEYERKRAQALKLAERKSFRHSRSRSDSKSPSHHHYRARSTSNASKSGTLYEKLDEFSRETVSLFKGLQGIQISTTELRRIKVDIRRNIPAKGSISCEIKRAIVNPEDVVLKRREGEGCKPIFDREEIKIVSTNEVEEQRTVVVTVDREQPVSTSKLQTSSRKRSLSLSPIRYRGYSPGYLSSHQSRRSKERRREHKERHTERDANKYDRYRSRSRERGPSTSNFRSFMEDRTYRDRSRRERSSESSRERRDRDRNKSRSREPRNVTPHYIEPMPTYYNNFLPRPFVRNPMMPLRGPVPPMGRGQYPGLMAPIRPFPPGFIPPDMYRMGPQLPNLCIYTNKYIGYSSGSNFSL